MRNALWTAALMGGCFLWVGCDETTVGSDGGASDAGATDAGPDLCMELSLPSLTTESIDGSFGEPIFLTQPAGDDGLYIADKAGTIVRIDGDGATEFANIADGPDGAQVGGERGLLGLAFHPGFASNGRYFVYYTPGNEMANRVEEWSGSGASAAPVRTLLNHPDPEGNHNGGMLVFGPDGFLYVGMGDGGGGGDDHGAFGNGLNRMSPFGKIHRLDVDNEAGQFAAAGNPFAGGDGLATIWAYGLRNPWRFSFDRATGDLWIGDVGQGTWEEVDFQPASSTGGENYGWRAYEGYEVFSEADVDQVDVHSEPVYVYDHGAGCSITGGYVYRGSAIPELRGWYLFADYCSGEVHALRLCDGEAVGEQLAIDLGGSILSFGEDQDGELYVLRNGSVHRIVAAP